MKTAIAVFSKTPGLSPIKTRLAQGSSRELSQDFHRLACKALQSTLLTVRGRAPLETDLYLAVAEHAAVTFHYWKGFTTIWQGPGELGEKLAHTYRELKQRYDVVLLLGTDSPQIDTNVFETAFDALTRSSFCIGPAHDGGFYLFGGRKAVPYELWSDIEYSHPETEQQLHALFSPFGSISELDAKTDVDVFEDLRVLKKELLALTTPTTEQIRMLKWLQRLERNPSIFSAAHSEASSGRS